MSKKKEAVVEEWRRLISECENRPKGVKFSDWCKSVGVSKTNYYYWKKRLRELESDTPQIVKVEADTLYLFCGRRHNKLKGLVWERDGFLLLYRRLSDGYFQWPKYAEDVRKLTQEQFIDLMEGFAIERKVTIRKVNSEV